MGMAIAVYVGISCFGIMNAIIGVIVTRTSQAAREADEEDQANYRAIQMEFVDAIKDIIYEIDTSGDGTISPEEIVEAQDNPSLVEALEHVELPYGFSMSELHCMLDKDGDGELTKGEFGQGMKRLIFSNDFQRTTLLMLAIAQSKRKLYEMRLENIESSELMVAELKALPKKLQSMFQEVLDKHVPKEHTDQGDMILHDDAH